MHIDKYESAFMWLSAIMLLVFGGAILISVTGLQVTLPGHVEHLPPGDVLAAPGFSEPGLREVYEGRYEVYMVLGNWTFTPNEIEVPVGSEVTFFLASADVTHGFKVFDTNVNIMVIPGQVSEVTHTFKEAGDYQFYCHEYCGAPHHTMTGVVHVVGD